MRRGIDIRSTEKLSKTAMHGGILDFSVCLWYYYFSKFGNFLSLLWQNPWNEKEDIFMKDVLSKDSENKKIKLLIVGIIMNCAGTEKSFLAFANALDYGRYDVTLLLAKKEGRLLGEIPKQIKVVTMDQRYADLFLLSGANSVKTMWNCFVKRNPLTLFEMFPYVAELILFPKRREAAATRLWCHMMKKMPAVDGKYDVCAAYWGERTMFYMCEKINSDKMIAWFHSDYCNPRRDDKTYLKYFCQCDNIITVSELIGDSLKDTLPQIADKCTVIENINDPATIYEMSKHGDDFDDEYDGVRILTVARICGPKGQDMAVEALGMLKKEGYKAHWYFLGGGDPEEIETLKRLADKYGVSDDITLLGTTDNPYTYLRNCDIFALTTRFEGKPISVEEAKILKKPILVTNYVSASEQLSGGDFGVICDMTPESIFDGLKKLVGSPELRQQFSHRLSEHDFGNKSEIEKFYSMVEDR